MEEKVLRKAVIIFPLRGANVYLAVKGGKIGAGCRNGYGGGIEEGETPVEAAVRELRQESGVIARTNDCEKVAEVYFHNQKVDGSFYICECHVFVVRKWQGRVRATDEMKDPRLFSIRKLPIADMMPADPSWVPLVLRRWKLVVNAWYGPYQKVLLQPTRVRYVTGFTN